MAKLELTFCGVTDTLKPDGSKESSINITMSTGSEHKEGYCYYDVRWKKITIVRDPNDPRKSSSVKSEGSGTTCFALNLQNGRFTKKMYSPNEIFAEIQIAPGTPDNEQKDNNVTCLATIPRDTLEKSFLNKKVTLKCDDKSVCEDYFVQEIMPTYKKDAMYVTFKMYSPDFLLTQENYCRTFVSKKLGAEILTEEIKNYTLPYDSKTALSIDFSNMKHIKLAKDDEDGHKAGTEHLFSYLVQYNESFYDFLKRTTNRWGEFLYYEDKKLVMGYGYAGTNNTDYKDVAESATYCDLTCQQKQSNPGQLHAEAPIDEQIQSNVLTKGGYDTVKTRMNSILPSNFTKLDGDIYVVKKLAAFLNNDKTIFQFLVDTVVDDIIDLEKANGISDEKNDKFDSDYFSKKRTETKFNDNQFNGSTEFNQFSEYKPFLNTKTYIGIVEKEFAAGRNAIVMDFDTTYPDIKLGQVIIYDKKNYLVVNVEGYQPEKMAIVDNQYVDVRVDMSKVCYKVTAVPENRVVTEEEKEVEVEDKTTGQKTKQKQKVKVYDPTYYPPVIPEGHIRRSGPQLAEVVEGTKDDPLRKNRVRIKYGWQGAKEWSSPWLLYSPGGGASKAGVYSWHEKGQKVMIDYVAGNIERPYVTGSVEVGMPAQLKTYQQVFQTPAEQKILMTDGTGAGLTAMLASINPGFKLIQSFWPGDSLPGLDFEKSANLEGNIELTDKYGFYSIKGSTNDRNVSIKSPWGDVKIDAFTGITISAPNGDVKIKGKNVSIEAGGNLTLTSGKNIKQRWYMDGEDADAVTLASTITKTVTSKAASMLVNITDLSLIRHIIEVIFKPVEGKVQITAGRYMMLESGGKKAGYPIDAYKKESMDDKRDFEFDDLVCCLSFERLKSQINQNYNRMKAVYNDARQRKEALATLINECKNDRGEAQCKSLDQIISALWDDPKKAKKDLFEFKGIYKDVKEDDDIDEAIIRKFLPGLGLMAQRRMDNPDFRRRRWQDAIAQQEIKKDAMVKAVKRLALLIEVLKSFDVTPQRLPVAFDKLSGVVKNANLPADCLFKTMKDKDEYKQFTAEFQVEADEKKKVFRQLFIALVKAFEIPRSATESAGVGMKATVFPEPQPDCSDADWTKYCNSIQTIRKKENKSTGDKVLSTIGDKILDPLKGMFDIKGFMAFSDDCSFGSSKKGEILFASGDGTMVLDRGIYRANVGGWENYDDGVQRPVGNGYVSRVRNVMLSV
jgi:hypothetical protein